MDRPTDGQKARPTDGPADGRTDTCSYRDARTHLEIVFIPTKPRSFIQTWVAVQLSLRRDPNFGALLCFVLFLPEEAAAILDKEIICS